MPSTDSDTLTAPDPPPERSAVIVEVLAPKALPSPEDFDRSLEDHHWQVFRQHLKLTRREMQVLRSIVRGCKFIAIASVLGISRHTVDTHWRHIKRKLRVHNRVEAIEVVHEHQLHAAIEAATTPLNEQINALKQQIRELEGEVVRLQHSE